jgi:hypothetical protein
MRPLSNYIDTLDMVRSYAAKQLGNAQLQEKTSSVQETDDYGETCTVHSIDGESDWETIRLRIVDGLQASLPEPSKGRCCR